MQNFLNNTCTQPDGSITCPGQNSNEDFFTWSSCARANSTDTMVNDAFRLATPLKRYEEDFNGEFYVIYLVIAFSALTSISHFSIASCLYGYYRSELGKFRQPLRWLEYSITASIMMVVVLLLCNMTNAFILGAVLLPQCPTTLRSNGVPTSTVGCPILVLHDYTPRLRFASLLHSCSTTVPLHRG